MKAIRKNLFGKIFTVSVMALFLIAATVSPVPAAKKKSAPKKSDMGIRVRHEPIRFFVPEKRIRLNAEISKGRSEIKLVRCYFRATEQADYVFVEMVPARKGNYEATLPAPSSATESLQYLFLVVNQKDQVIKTQAYSVKKQDEKKTPKWQQMSSEGEIHVSTEVGEAQTSVPGFSDSIVMDVVESSLRFGVVAGEIYAVKGATTAGTAASTASTSSAAETGTVTSGVSSTASGTATAETVSTSGTAVTGTTSSGTGLSTGTWIGIGVGAAALVGGLAALGGGGGGGGDAPPVVPADIISTWGFYSRCAESLAETPVEISIRLNETKGGSFSGSDDYGTLPIKVSINGDYDAKTRSLSGTIETKIDKSPLSSCVRYDRFGITLSSDDTGYQEIGRGSGCDSSQEQGCTLQIRFVKK